MKKNPDMNTPDCERTADIIRAIKTNAWTAKLRNHQATCPLCQETVEATILMNRISNEPAGHPLAGYQIPWMKAQYARRQERLTKLDLVSLIAIALGGIAGLVGLSAGIFPRAFAALLALTGNSLPALKSLVASNAPLGVLVGAGVLVWLLTQDRLFARR